VLKEVEKPKIKPARLIDTIADVGSLFMAIMYILYVVLLLIFKLGPPWLNWCMLSITIIYIIFFVSKVAALNSLFEKKQFQRQARFILRYSKWAMKIINATFVCIAIATTKDTSHNVIMLVGVFVVGFSFLISVMWDVLWVIVRRRMKDFKGDWDNLSPTDRSKRVEMILDAFFHSLDNITGVDITESVKTTAAGRLKKQDQELLSQGQISKEFPEST
jgi:hypothetical protein